MVQAYGRSQDRDGFAGRPEDVHHEPLPEVSQALRKETEARKRERGREGEGGRKDLPFFFPAFAGDNYSINNNIPKLATEDRRSVLYWPTSLASRLQSPPVTFR